jgi:hypothetical protein
MKIRSLLIFAVLVTAVLFSGGLVKASTTPTCPSGMTWDASLSLCTGLPTCPTGMTWNTTGQFADSCTGLPTCPTGMTWNTTGQFADSCTGGNQPCPYGENWNASWNVCTAIQNCPYGENWNASWNVCTAIQNCPYGENWNASLNLCTAPTSSSTCIANSNCSIGQTCVSGFCESGTLPGTACTAQGVCVQSNTSDGSGCTVGNNSKCVSCNNTTKTCVRGIYDGSKCVLGTTCNNPPSTQIACIGAAVNARETAVDAAMAAYTASVNSAYSARATALQSAYQLTTLTTVQAADKAAWTSFNTSVKTARSTWLVARNTAWATYVKVGTACKAVSGTGDGIYSEYELSGQ